MIHEEYDIQRQVETLMDKVLEMWKREGKWDGDNPTAPFYGLEKDPMINLLLTAFAYQGNAIEKELKEMNAGLMNEFEDIVLPYNLTQAVPSFSMVTTAKTQGNDKECYVDENCPFLLKRETIRTREYFPFHPLFKIKILGARISKVRKLSADKWNVVLDVSDENTDLSSVGFFLDDVKIQDLNIYWGEEKIPLIKPWEYDRFPLNPWFSEPNVLYNKAMMFSSPELWSDLWASRNINFYMVDSQYHRPINETAISLIFEFVGVTSSFTFGMENLVINGFPIVNVVKKEFSLSQSNPLVKIADETGWEIEEDTNVKNPYGVLPDNSRQDCFMHLIMDDDISMDDFDRIVIRRFGNERFNLNELVNLANELNRRYESDFYAFQQVNGLQNSDKSRRLEIVLKDIMNVVKECGVPKSGVYALMKRGTGSAKGMVKLSALFTDGACANDIDTTSSVVPPKVFEKKETRLLMKTVGGKGELTDREEKKMLAKYYLQTHDRIVTRADLKAFCIRFFAQNGMKNAVVDVVSTIERRKGNAVQKVVIHLAPQIVKRNEDIPILLSQLQKMITVRSAGITPVEINAAGL